MKYDWLVFAQRGIQIAGYDDTMLISYVLDAGKGGHGMDDLAKRWLNHDTIHFHHVAGQGKSQVTFDCVAIDKATEYAAEDADVTLRLERRPQPQRDVGVLGGVFGGLVDGHAVERHLRFTLASDVVEVDGVVVEPALGEIVHAVAAFTGVQHIGNQHSVVVTGDLDAALGEHQPVVFHVLCDFEDASCLLYTSPS